jgi:hypothetical protein
MHPLDGPLAKIERAQSQIVTLQESVQGFFRDHLYEIGVAEYNPEADNYSLRVRSGPKEFPVDWSLLIGEIAHNLRSALDGVVYQLVRANNKWPSFNTQFPIFLVGKTKRHRGKRKAFIPNFEGKDFADGLSMINGVAERHIAVFRRFQPYKRGNGNRKCPLHLLKELNNTDKHRLITVVSPTPAMLQFSGMAGRVHFKRRVTLRPNAKIGWVRDVPPNKPGGGGVYLLDFATMKLLEPEMKVDVTVTPSIAFADTCKSVQGLPVLFTLQSMVNQAHRIIEAFRGGN